ncbi:MAG: hypothetical protein ACLT1W_11840 [Alistipes onderdonkii]
MNELVGIGEEISRHRAVRRAGRSIPIPGACPCRRALTVSRRCILLKGAAGSTSNASVTCSRLFHTTVLSISTA